jgi:diguanylate cyclase (GGDEF)-like protein
MPAVRVLGYGLMLLLWTSAAFAVESPRPLSDNAKPLNQFSLSIWNTADGLPHNSVNSIAQDRQGYIWLATWEGPVRYNGTEFTVFDDLDELEMPESGTLGLATDPESGDIWFSGPRGGITRFDGEEWAGQPLAPSFVFQLARTLDGSVWAAASNGGIARYEPDQAIQTYTAEDGLPANFAYRVYTAPARGQREERLWAGTSAGLAYYSAGNNQFITVDSLPPAQVRAMLLHSNGMLLVATSSGLFYQNEANGDFAPWPDPISKSITALAEGPEGGIWFGTYTRGLGRISNAGVSWLSTDAGLPNPQVLAIFKDKEDNMWVSTHSGLVQLRNSLFTSYTRTHGLVGNFARAVIEDTSGKVWVATNEGLSIEKDGQFTPASPDPDLQSISLLSLTPGQDKVMYAGSYNQGVLQITDGEVTAQLGRDDGLELPEIRALATLPERNLLLVGTPSGLHVVRTGAGQLDHLRHIGVEDGLVDSTVTSIAVAGRDTIFLSSTGGISQLDTRGEPADWQAQIIDLESFTPSRNIFGSLHRDGTSWFAADRGLLAYEHAADSWHWLSRQHGLPRNKYFTVSFDPAGNMWLGSNRGVTRVSAASLAATLTDESSPLEVMQFSETDGMASSQVNTGGPSSILDSQGRLWFATALGATSIDPALSAQREVDAPPAVIEFVSSDTEDSFAPGTELNADALRVEFHYAGLGYQMTDHIEFQVRLLGFEDEWINQGRLRTAQYTRLPPGEYRFEVRSRYPGGDWSEADALEFSKAPYLWQTQIFWIVVAFLAALLIYLLLVSRTYRLQRSREQLQQLVDEKTRELVTLANEDALTGLANRRAFDHRVQEEVLYAKARKRSLSLALVDLDHFKHINDKYLHAAGDEVLVQVADVLRKSIRDIDYVARWGGEEFAIVFPNAKPAEAAAVCERIRAALRQTRFAALNADESITVSVGIAGLGEDYNQGQALLNADRALYQAKQQGRDQVVIAE